MIRRKYFNQGPAGRMFSALTIGEATSGSEDTRFAVGVEEAILNPTQVEDLIAKLADRVRIDPLWEDCD